MKKLDNINPITPEEFLEFIKNECDEAGVRYFFPETESVSYPGYEDMKVSGYFDDVPSPILACAIGKPIHSWYQILVHESCHMDQWKENNELWRNIRKDGIDADKTMDEWLNGKNYEADLHIQSIRIMQAVELDCEKRSVAKIEKLNLPIEIKAYIKAANAYLFFYSVILTTRKWSDIPPYNVQEITDLMPDEFLNLEDYLVISDELLEIYKTKCYN